MTTLLIAVGVFFAYLVAYHTYGRFLARRIFRLDPKAVVPSVECRDDIDFCPTNKHVIFGHHYTSIAGTGPIVGPAIAVFWGWLPALLWVLIGPIFIGAVHDFGALVVSLRNRGQTVGDIAGRMVAPRVKYLFLLVLFFALTLVIAIFGLVIATIFKMYPESVLSVWIELPVAVAVGFYVYKFRGALLLPSLMALGLMYGAIYVGVYYLPIRLPVGWGNPVVIWTIILLTYCYVASVLPVWVLLQPRDYINSHQLIVALTLLAAGVVVAGLAGAANINSAPPIVPAADIPTDAPPIWPFLFVTIACGAISGFHCLVSSGTTSKQIAKETDAQFVGYGSMLLEGVLAVLVILACCAGVGMGKYVKAESADGVVASTYVPKMVTVDGQQQHLKGKAAWRDRYNPDKKWGDFGLGDKLGAFIEGGANFLAKLGIPLELAIGIMAVLVASFAATTLDTATRLHRYVIQELAAATRIKPLTNKFAATGLAVLFGGAMAMLPAPGKTFGTGGLILWPLFGATNQLLAGLAFMVVFFYLWRRRRPVWFMVPPMALMLIMPLWALLWQMFNRASGWYFKADWALLWEKIVTLPSWIGTGDWSWFSTDFVLFPIGIITIALQCWIIVEALLMIPRVKGVLEEALPPLSAKPAVEPDGGRSC